MSRAGFLGRSTIWFAVTFAVCAAHVAAAQFLLVNVAAAPRTLPPEPVIIELSTEPTPPEAVSPEARTETAEAAQPEAAPAEELPPEPEPEVADATPVEEPVEPPVEEPVEDPPPEVAEPELPPLPTLPPVQDLADLLPEPAEPPPDFAVPDFAALPPVGDFAALVPPETQPLATSRRPAPRPERAPPPEPEVKQAQPEKPRRERTPAREPRTEPAQRQQAKAEPRAAASSRQSQAAPTAGQKAPSRAQMQSWQSQVGARISRHMARTRLSGGGGAARVQVSVTIGANGAASARLVSSTGDARADAALARQAARLPRMPAPPGGKGQSFVQPIRVEF